MDAARVSATPWNRTRTSRASAERADHLRKSGISKALARLAIVDIRLSRPVGTVSLSFHCELLLGKPSIHMCCSRLQFGLRGSNSHFQSQSLAFCRLNEARSW